VLIVLISLSSLVYYFKIFPQSVSISFAVIASILATVPVLISALYALVRRKVSVDLLASFAMIFSLLSAQWASALFIGLMLAAARIFLTISKKRARRGIESLLKLKPSHANIKRSAGVVRVAIGEIITGDIVVTELGERIPVDGVVIKGDGSIDESSITGESMPVNKKIGDLVVSSTIIVAGFLEIKVTCVGKDTMLEKIIGLVESSELNKAHVTTSAERFAGWYILIIGTVSLVLFFLTHNLAFVLSFVLVVCADDIAVAIPLAFLTAIGYAAKRGVIIKGGEYVESLHRAKVVVLDKTGTITKGLLKVEHIIPFNDASLKTIFSFGGMISILSSHPASKALLSYIKERGMAVSDPDRFEEFGGRGAIARYGNTKVFIGKSDFLKEQGVIIGSEEQKEIQNKEEEGLSVTLLAADGNIIGAFCFADTLKPDIKKTLNDLRSLGVEKIVMLTGDNERAARRIALAAGIDTFHANLLPEEKIKHLQSYLNPNYSTIMIGDGLNDAAALALADVGIVMGGTGYDVSIESADIVLMKDNFSRIPEMIRLSRSVVAIARQNYVIWAAVNVVGVTLVFSGLLYPTTAALYNFATDFLPLANSARMFGLFFKKEVQTS
jgi:heavy metal translocating P-type ATPase